MYHFMDFTDPSRNPLYIPSRWPRWLRRSFLLTLPASGPVWFFVCVSLASMHFFGCFLHYIVEDVSKLWRL